MSEAGKLFVEFPAVKIQRAESAVDLGDEQCKGLLERVLNQEADKVADPAGFMQALKRMIVARGNDGRVIVLFDLPDALAAYVATDQTAMRFEVLDRGRLTGLIKSH
jgi:hypothetical protein